MARHLWSIPCQRAIVDSETNAVSYIQAIEEYAVPQFPYQGLPFTLGTLWLREDGDESLEARVRIISPSGKEILSHTFGPKPIEKLRFRLNFVLNNYQVDVSGIYSTITEQKTKKGWVEVNRMPLRIRTVEEARAGNQTSGKMAAVG